MDPHGSRMVDLFSGSGSMSRSALDRGCQVVGVDACTAPGVWTGDPYRPVSSWAGPQDPDHPDFCPAALRGHPAWPYWWTNSHQMKPVHYRGYITREDRPRVTVPGFRACTECHLILEDGGTRTPAFQVAPGKRVFVCRTVATRTRRRVWLRDYPFTVAEIFAGPAPIEITADTAGPAGGTLLEVGPTGLPRSVR